jgi:hypothetical protein
MDHVEILSVQDANDNVQVKINGIYMDVNVKKLLQFLDEKISLEELIKG